MHVSARVLSVQHVTGLGSIHRRGEEEDEQGGEETEGEKKRDIIGAK